VIIIAKLIQNIVAPYVVKKLPEGKIGSNVILANKIADNW
jgi:hypothetical protein